VFNATNKAFLLLPKVWTSRRFRIIKTQRLNFKFVYKLSWRITGLCSEAGCQPFPNAQNSSSTQILLTPYRSIRSVLKWWLASSSVINFKGTVHHRKYISKVNLWAWTIFGTHNLNLFVTWSALTSALYGLSCRRTLSFKSEREEAHLQHLNFP